MVFPRPSLRAFLLFSAALHLALFGALSWVPREPLLPRPERPPLFVELPPLPQPTAPARSLVRPRPEAPPPPGPNAAQRQPAPAAPPLPAPPPPEVRPTPAPEPQPALSPPPVAKAPEASVSPPTQLPGREPAGPRFSLLSPKLDVPVRPQLPGGEGTDSQQSGQNGAPVPLTTRDPRYLDYFVVLACRIEERMAYPEKAIRDRTGGRLLVEFSLDKNGRVESTQVREPSGHSALDDASLLAIRLAAPFPPIPPQIGKDHLAISAVFHWIFEDGFRRFPPLGLTCPRARS